MNKKIVYILVVVAAIVFAVFYFKADPAPEHIEEQFNTDSSQDGDTTVQDAFDELNGMDFDFDEEVEDSTAVEAPTDSITE